MRYGYMHVAIMEVISTIGTSSSNGDIESKSTIIPLYAEVNREKSKQNLICIGRKGREKEGPVKKNGLFIESHVMMST